jgi:hypothetical protein
MTCSASARGRWVIVGALLVVTGLIRYWGAQKALAAA